MNSNPRFERISLQSFPLSSGNEQIVLGTSTGDIECIFHRVDGSRGVIWVSGARGGFDGPASGIYARLSREMVDVGINSLRLNYRFPGNFDQCVLDVLIGIRFLELQGIDRIALVGHSFGGAVVIMAGTVSIQVKTVVGLSSQTVGAQRVNELSPVSLLLVHGDSDQILPARCSHDIFQRAGEPKELVIFPDCGHLLTECQEELHDLLRDWLITNLN